MTKTNSRTSSLIRFVLKAGITVAVFAYLASKIDMGAVGNAIMNIDLSLFALSLGILIVRNVIGGYRHQTLLSYMDCNPGLIALTRLYFLSAFFSMFLPTVVGGDIARGYYLYRYSGGRSETISTIIVERALGVYAMMLLSLIAVGIAVVSGFDVFQSDIIRMVFISFIAGLFVSLLFFSHKFERFILNAVPKRLTGILQIPIRIAGHVGSYRNAPTLLAKALLLSMSFQFVSIISTYILALSLGESTAFFYFLMFLPVVWLISMLPVSINGLGVRESAYVLLFGIAGMAEDAALALGLLWFIQTLLLGAIGGIDFLTGDHDYAGIVRFGREKNK